MQVASFLYYQEKMNVFMEPDGHDIFATIPGFEFVKTFYIQYTCDLLEKVDFVACLGGDGVILHASNLFRGPVLFVVSFNLGSLGFLTSHNVEKLGRKCFFICKSSFDFDETSFGELYDKVTTKRPMLVSKPISYVFAYMLLLLSSPYHGATFYPDNISSSILKSSCNQMKFVHDH
ncbi:hypothetical protein RIF29_29551 [Crotalaria pallida]|uniref:NAD(+) kinase n=1 Tax=Crotalaria pallida TaxID=3830 RepID=A0AAN9HW02_CROPI